MSGGRLVYSIRGPRPDYEADHDPEPVSGESEYSGGAGTGCADAPLSPLGKLRRGETGDRVG